MTDKDLVLKDSFNKRKELIDLLYKKVMDGDNKSHRILLDHLNGRDNVVLDLEKIEAQKQTSNDDLANRQLVTSLLLRLNPKLLTQEEVTVIDRPPPVLDNDSYTEGFIEGELDSSYEKIDFKTFTSRHGFDKDSSETS